MNRTLLCLALALCLPACAAPPPPAPAESAVQSGFVTDLPAFERFIAERPTPATFRARYPDVQLVMPGDITTKEFRSNNSRYHARLDAQGRIEGGRFM